MIVAEPRPGRMRPAMPSLEQLLHAPRFHPHWRVLLLLLALTAAWFAFTPRPPLPEFDGADKVNHLLAFGSMATAATLGWRAGWASRAGVGLGLLAYGGFIEIVQSQIPNRTAAWDDLAADAIGIAGGLLLAALLRWACRPRNG